MHWPAAVACMHKYVRSSKTYETFVQGTVINKQAIKVSNGSMALEKIMKRQKSEHWRQITDVTRPQQHRFANPHQGHQLALLHFSKLELHFLGDVPKDVLFR